MSSSNLEPSTSSATQNPPEAVMASHQSIATHSDTERDKRQKRNKREANISNENQNEAIFLSKDEVRNKCLSYSYLDGKFFDVDLEKSSLNGHIVAKCQNCTVSVQGRMTVSSNFVAHIKVILCEIFF
jgi:hypothetical protein